MMMIIIDELVDDNDDDDDDDHHRLILTFDYSIHVGFDTALQEQDTGVRAVDGHAH